MNALTHALLAVVAIDDGDSTAAQAHISSAQRHSRTSARRERQVVEIAALVVSGDRARAAGLARVHIADFPDDAELLARVAQARR